MAIPTCAPASDGKLTAVIGNLPPGLGNPLTSGGFPPLLIWPALFDALSQIGADGELKPTLATSWRVENPTTWIFDLRPGVTFSNGEPFDAEAVMGTVNFLRSESGRRFSAYREVQTIQDMRARGPLTLEITTTQPDSMLAHKLAGVWILPPKYFAQVGAERFALQPIGTGPYTAAKWNSAKLDLTPFAGSWRKPRLAGLTIRALPEATSRAQAIISRAADIAFDLDLEDIEAVEAAGARIDLRKRAAVQAWQYITELPSPLQDARVRLALNLAVDRQSIVDTILQGRTRVPSQVAAVGVFGHDDTLAPYPYDSARAKALLAEAGYPDGFDATFQIYTDGPADASIYQQAVADLAKVGVRIKIARVTPQVNNEGLYNGKWAGIAFNMNWGSLPSLDIVAALRYHSCLWPTPWICRPEIVDLMKAADAEFDRDKRKAVIRQILRALHDDPPAILLFENIHPDGIGPRVLGYDAPFGFIRYESLSAKD
ncbi:MAG: ABC transporter substrate-binding protein [Rhodospirillaceae bacterium]|nr:ABC transporter substrate-binding protein [Rhodospirillaceae bacterium]